MLDPGHRDGQAFVSAEKIMSTCTLPRPYAPQVAKNRVDTWLPGSGASRHECRSPGSSTGQAPEINTYPENGRTIPGPHLKRPWVTSADCCSLRRGITSQPVPAVSSKVDLERTDQGRPCGDPSRGASDPFQEGRRNRHSRNHRSKNPRRTKRKRVGRKPARRGSRPMCCDLRGPNEPPPSPRWGAWFPRVRSSLSQGTAG